MDKVLDLILPDNTKKPLTEGLIDAICKWFAEDRLRDLGIDEESISATSEIYAIATRYLKKQLVVLVDNGYQEIPIGLLLEMQRENINKLFDDTLALINRDTKTYFAVPTVTGKLTGGFGIGLKKHLDYTTKEIPRGTLRTETVLTYFTLEDPKTNVNIQYSLFENPDTTQLAEHQTTLQRALGPYGLQVFYSLMAQCDDNNRQTFFYLNVNNVLDRMGLKRDKKGRHQTNNKERLLDCIDKLAKVEWNVVSGTPDPKDRKKQIVTKIHGPLVNITAQVDTYKAEKDDLNTPKTKPVRDGMYIGIHQEIYKMIDSQYTKFPKAFLMLDNKTEAHQIQLYAFINHQWKIGWHSHRGVIKYSLDTIIEKSGIPLPTRSDKKLLLVKKIIGELKKMKNNQGLWIGEAKLTPPAKPLTGRIKEVDRLLSQIVTITASEDHPLRNSMKEIDMGNFTKTLEAQNLP